ncbi:MAG: four helix bundle protein [Saprospiraceae bacterium]
MNSIAYDKAYLFAIRIVKLNKFLVKNKEFTLSNQILRSGTSIGANLAEANGGISISDFSSKVSIAFKECRETRYWLSLLKDTDYISQEQFDSIDTDAEEISKILFAILKTTSRVKKKNQT